MPPHVSGGSQCIWFLSLFLLVFDVSSGLGPSSHCHMFPFMFPFMFHLLYAYVIWSPLFFFGGVLKTLYLSLTYERAISCTTVLSLLSLLSLDIWTRTRANGCLLGVRACNAHSAPCLGHCITTFLVSLILNKIAFFQLQNEGLLSSTA